MDTRNYGTIPTTVNRMSLTNMLNPTPENAYAIMKKHITTLAEGNTHLCVSELVGAGFLFDEAVAQVEDFMNGLEH